MPRDAINATSLQRTKDNNKERLISILSNNLDFKDERDFHNSHRVHSFPAKFPPQLPRILIKELTEPGDIVLDPMQGSGTTLLEALLAERRAIGFDIDPLALLLSRVKLASYDISTLKTKGEEIITNAEKKLQNKEELKKQIIDKYDEKTRDFINYWFSKETQLELIALITAIEENSLADIKDFFYLAFSSVIITKTGGVSLALDLAHTRPHKAKIVKTIDGNFIVGAEITNKEDPKIKILTKILRSPIEMFKKKIKQNLQGVVEQNSSHFPVLLTQGNSQSIPLADNSVDLIVTSPPYAANAIDYMRAHKFSLVWFGKSIDSLAVTRKTYIGGEATTGLDLVSLPILCQSVIECISVKNKKKALSLHRYYSEMTLVLKEMYRVLKHSRAAILVVGNSILSGENAEVPKCLAEIGKATGFEVPKIGVRKLDRNKRMLAAGMNRNGDCQIQKRMYEDYLIGFYK